MQDLHNGAGGQKMIPMYELDNLVSIKTIVGRIEYLRYLESEYLGEEE